MERQTQVNLVFWAFVAEEDVANVLKEVGISPDPAQLKALIEALKGKKLHEIIAGGMSKIQNVSAAGIYKP